MKCKCGNCKKELISPELQKWDGKMKANIMIAGDQGLPVHVATIQIEGIPLLLEPWLLQRVIINATKEISKYVANFDSGKTVN